MVAKDVPTLLFWFGPQVSFRKRESPWNFPWTLNTFPRILLYNFGELQAIKQLSNFKAWQSSHVPSRRWHTLFFLSSSPQVWSMKSDQDIKREPGRVAVADEVRMDLSPHEFLWSRVSGEVSLWRCDESQGHQSLSPADRLLSTSHHFLTGPRAQLEREIRFEHYSLVRKYWFLSLLFLGRHSSPNPILSMEKRYFSG